MGVFEVIQLIILVASIVYQRKRAAKLRARANAEADKQKGFQIIAEGESAPITVFYGRNKVGGTRVYHKVTSSYVYTAPAAGAIVFVNKGDSRTTDNRVSSIVVTAVSTTNPTGGTYLITGRTITSPIVGNQMTIAVDAGQNTRIVAGQTVTVTHPPLYLTATGTQLTTQTPFSYTIASYNNATGSLVVALTSVEQVYRTPSLNASVSNTVNEFLFIQQVISYGGISNVYAVDVDDKDWTDPSFNVGKDVESSGSIRVHIYPSGNVVDPMVQANDNTRTNSVFSNTAYASMVFRLNRDEPNFGGGIPQVQFYLEGQKVYTVLSNGTLSGAKTYSNNPAFCLLDYLMDPVYGKGLASTSIDLLSFYAASRICNTQVPVNMSGSYTPIVNSAGKLWREKSKDGTQRIIKLYECNLGIDTTKSVRDNIEILLETMGQAELLWSGGKYKLALVYPLEWSRVFSNYVDSETHRIVYTGSYYQTGDIVQYPAGYTSSVDLYRSLLDNNNLNPTVLDPFWAKDVVKAYLLDKDIIREEAVTQSWPNVQNKLNYFTVKFLNESNDFAEDSVSWPPKTGADTTVYTAYLAEDNGQLLEGETFQIGDTTEWHALATAEEHVRASRAQVVYQFGVPLRYTYLEPGDIIKVTSTVLSIPGELLKVEECKVNERNQAIIQAVKYDARHLAWNAKDNEVVKNRNIYNGDELGQASNLNYVTAGPLINGLAAGTLSWDKSGDPRVVDYVVKIVKTSLDNISFATIWLTLDTTTENHIELAPLAMGSYVVTVISRDSLGKMAPFMSPTTGSHWPLLVVVAGQSSLGVGIYPLSIYKRSPTLLSIAPVNPGPPYGASGPGGIFDVAPTPPTLSSIPTGWSTVVPPGTDAIYISQATAKVIYPSTTDNTFTWSVPALYSGSGSAGLSSRGLRAYYQGTATPSTPNAGTGSYHFTTQVFTPPTGDVTWVAIQPSSSGGTIWFSDSTATLQGTTGLNTNSLVWTLPATSVEIPDITATAYLYKWSVVDPETAPTSGSTVYTWSTGTQTVGTALQGGWAVSIPAKPDIPGVQLWEASKYITARAGTITTDITWGVQQAGTGPVYLRASSRSAIDGLKYVTAECYRWDSSAIAPTATGAFTYTWAGGAISAYPLGWTAAPTGGSPGLALWKASVKLSGTASELTQNANWTSSIIAIVGFYGNTGATGTTERIVISAPSMVFTKTTLAAPSSPASITMTATAYGGVPSSYNWQVYSGSWTNVGITIATYTITESAINDNASKTYRCQAIINGTTYTDEYTIAKIVGGTNGITVLLQNQAVALPADLSGAVTAYNGSGTGFDVYIGNTPINYATSGNSSWSVVASGTNITVGSMSNGVYADHSNFLTAQNNAYIDYTVSVRDSMGTPTTYSLRQSFTKAKIGATGTGTAGAAGAAGISARIAYGIYTTSSLNSNTVTTVGLNTFPPNGSWGAVGSTWNLSNSGVILTAGQYLFQTDGLYDPATTQTIWQAPYLSALKVGSLSAISANLGTITSGSIHSGSFHNGGLYNWPGNGIPPTITWTAGSYLGAEGFIVGTGATNTSYLKYDSQTGQFYIKADITGSNGTFSGTLKADTVDVVSTLNLRGNAVNIPNYYTSTNQFSLTYWSWTNIASTNISTGFTWGVIPPTVNLTITVAGLVVGTATSGARVALRVKRGTTLLHTAEIRVARIWSLSYPDGTPTTTAEDGNYFQVISINDAGASMGNNTYTLEAMVMDSTNNPGVVTNYVSIMSTVILR